MPKGVQYQVVLGDDFSRAREALRHVDKALPRKLRQALIDAAGPAVKDAQSRVQSIPTYGHEHTGLRRRVARGVKVLASPAAEVPYLRVVTSMPAADEAIIPRGLDRQEGWRHPVFGNRDHWVTQHTGGSWFREAIADHRDDFERGLTDALEWAADYVDRAS